MANRNSGQNQVVGPQYSIGEIMDLLEMDQSAVRELIIDAGVDLDPSKNDPGERIAYADYRKLWVSRANRREGRKLSKLLVEESTSWMDRLFKA